LAIEWGSAAGSGARGTWCHQERQLVLPRCSARSSPARNPAAASSSSPAFGSNRSCSFFFNHKSHFCALGGGGKAGMGTRAAEAVAGTSRAWGQGLFLAQPQRWGAHKENDLADAQTSSGNSQDYRRGHVPARTGAGARSGAWVM